MSIFPNLASVAATALVTESYYVKNQCDELMTQIHCGFKIQGVVTYMLLLEAFGTTITFFDGKKVGLIT